MSIKKELTKGVFWIALAKYSGIFISLGITAILARHITPAAFGTMAVATVILAFLEIFSDLGIGTAVIQFKDLSDRQLNSLFTISCVIGIILALLLYFLSSPISEYYGDPQLRIVGRCLSITLLFYAFNVVPNGLMLKNKRFKVVSLRTLTFQIISGTVAVWGAMHGWGIYSLIVTPVISSIGVFIVNYYNYPQKFIFEIHYKAVEKVWKYSSFQFLFNISNYFSRNIDKLIIGKYFSMADLGYYDKSYRLMQLPLQNITFVITPVLHPILSGLQDDKAQISEKNIQLVSVLSQISFPLGLILYFCASEIIEIIFGPLWEQSIPIFKILSLSVPIQVILSTSGSIFLASGKSNHLFYVGVINTVMTIMGFFTAAVLFRTIESMAWAWNITLILVFINTYYVMYRKTLHSNIIVYFKTFLPQIINSSIVFSIVVLINPYLDFSNNFLSLTIKTSIIIGITLLLGYILNQYNVVVILQYIMNVIRSKFRLNK